MESVGQINRQSGLRRNPRLEPVARSRHCSAMQRRLAMTCLTSDVAPPNRSRQGATPFARHDGTAGARLRGGLLGSTVACIADSPRPPPAPLDSCNCRSGSPVIRLTPVMPTRDPSIASAGRSTTSFARPLDVSLSAREPVGLLAKIDLLHQVSLKSMERGTVTGRNRAYSMALAGRSTHD